MKTISITELCHRTGLSSRTLRFYEARGLLRADRTGAGLRCYDGDALARLHNISALKRAGFSLADIARLLDDGSIDLPRVIEAQLASLAAQSKALNEASASLFRAQRALKAGQSLDLDTFCTLIKQGETIMMDEAAWKRVADRYYTPEEQAHWAEKMKAAVPGGFDHATYSAQWADLGSRIAADLPIDPRSDKARSYLAEWNALLAPFNMVADERMKTETVSMYERMDEWAHEGSPGFTKAVWDFIKSVAAAAKP
jgi:MerR family transcriptional regulator, thiopeptide resistance regulator